MNNEVRTWLGVLAGLTLLATHSIAQPPVTPEIVASEAPDRLFTMAGPKVPETNTLRFQVRSLKFSPDGKVLATDIQKKKGREPIGHQVGLWDVNTGKLLWQVVGKTNFANAVAFSPDGEVVASLGLRWKKDRIAGSEISLLKTSTGQLLRSLQIPAGESVISLAFSPDGKVTAGGGMAEKDGKALSRVRFWDVQTGKLLRSINGLEGCPCAVAFSPDGKLLAAPTWRMKGEEILGGDVKLWDVASDKVQQTLSLQKVIVETIAISPDGSTLATNGSGVGENNIVEDSDIRLFDAKTGTLKHTLTREDERGRVESIDFSQDGKLLLGSGTAFGEKATAELWIWGTETGKLLRTLKTGKEFGDGEELGCLADLSPDGKQVAIGLGGSIELRNSEDGSLIRSFKLEQP